MKTPAINWSVVLTSLFISFCSARMLPPCDVFISHKSSTGSEPNDVQMLQDAVAEAKDGDTVCYRKSLHPYNDCGTRIANKSLTLAVETGIRGDAIIDCLHKDRYIWAGGSNQHGGAAISMSVTIEQLVLVRGHAAAGGLILAQVWRT